jgi:predicted GIY-YIG superfamily endonuclease
MSEFNILDCFDDNIDNIDLTKNYIYVLQLIEDRYYVGKSCNILRRIEEHFTGNGAIYTKKYKPLKVIEVEEEKSIDDERIKTLSIMKKYGWEKVRGYCWCSIELLKPPKVNNKKRKHIYKIVEKNEQDIILEKLYCKDNKDIIEIGKELNKTAGQIAYRLVLLDIIERRQQARGYFEYINSDMYKNICKKTNEKRSEKRIKNKNSMKDDIKEIKLDILDIKNKIRELILASKKS